MPEPKPRRGRRRKAANRRGVRWWLVGAGGVVLLILLGRFVYDVTDYGTVRIEMSDESAQVELAVDDRTSGLPGNTFRLRAGSHFVVVTGPDYGTVPCPFYVRRGRSFTLRVELPPKKSR